MKKLIMLATATAFMFSTTVMAQTSLLNKVKDSKEVKQAESNVTASANTRADKIAKDLKLTDAQKTQVTTLFTKQDASIAKLKTETKVGSPEYKTKLATIQKSGDTELQNIVGKDKFQQYQGNLKDEDQKAKDKANSKIKSLKGGLNIK